MITSGVLECPKDEGLRIGSPSSLWWFRTTSEFALDDYSTSTKSQIYFNGTLSQLCVFEPDIFGIRGHTDAAAKVREECGDGVSSKPESPPAEGSSGTKKSTNGAWGGTSTAPK